MQMPISEVADRYTILTIKEAKLKDAKLKLAAREERKNYYKALVDCGIHMLAVNCLVDVNAAIWDLEAEIRAGCDLPLEEIGRRALQIRAINGVRVRIKNRIAAEYSAYEEPKINHASA